MVNLKYQPRDGEACLAITTSSIDAIYAFHHSKFHQNTDRYSSVIYLAGAIIPLTCIIIKDGNDVGSDVRACAVRAFRKALSLLEDISPGHTFAKRMLARLRRIVDAANRKILNKERIDDRSIGASNNDEWLKRSLELDYLGGTQYHFEGSGGLLDDAFTGNLWDGDQYWPVFEMESFDTIL